MLVSVVSIRPADVRQFTQADKCFRNSELVTKRVSRMVAGSPGYKPSNINITHS